MGIKTYKPTSPGRRFITTSDFDDVTKTTPERSLLEPVKKTGGRNNNGRITTRHIGGGHKRRYRIIDFKRRKDGIPAKVASIEYDPNRSARIALLHYADGEKRYILAPLRLQVGDTVQSGAQLVDTLSGEDVDRHHLGAGEESAGDPVLDVKGDEFSRVGVNERHLRERHHALADTEQIEDPQMLLGLRLPSLAGVHHEEDRVDGEQSGQHDRDHRLGAAGGHPAGEGRSRHAGAERGQQLHGRNRDQRRHVATRRRRCERLDPGQCRR